jgi:tetratricopeptide (TPR) repeat protein
MAWLWNLRAQYLVARSRTSEAARIYREVLRSDPIHVPGIYVVLSDCRTRGAIDEAIDVATRALALDGEHFMALQTLAWAYVTQENHPAARAAVAKALEQFRAQRLDEPSNTLRTIDVLQHVLGPSASRRLRSPLAEEVAASLSDWKRWAESYLKSQAS